VASIDNINKFLQDREETLTEKEVKKNRKEIERSCDEIIFWLPMKDCSSHQYLIKIHFHKV
jgi:predicted KAP-like P-loop ATPase